MLKFTALFATASAIVLAAAPAGLAAQDKADPAPAATPAAAPDGVTAITVADGMATINVPPGWTHALAASATIITAPEGDAKFALVPIATAKDGDAAIAAAWASYAPATALTVELAQDLPGRDGWDATRVVNYTVPPAEKRVVQALALKRGDKYLVVLVDGALATLAKRGGQLGQSFGSLKPAGFAKESFAGKTPNPMDATRIAELKAFTLDAMAKLGVPGVGLALIDDGRIVYEGGLGVADTASGAKIGRDTRFMVASNTKGMATLLLATLVDEGKLDWDRPVTDFLPTFRLGSEQTTRKVLVKHLVCACTGLPRKDLEWLFNTRADTPASDTWKILAATEPTSQFGEVFQYNNLMATAAGYLGAHVLYPGMELGAGFDRAMKERVFEPLGMTRTTFDTDAAMAGADWAQPYGRDIDDKLVTLEMDVNRAIAPFRPAGGAWSTPHDMALYVLNELSEGRSLSGARVVSAKNLLARRVHNVPIGDQMWYGMGLMEDRSKGIPIIQHGGDIPGYHSNWFALPDSDDAIVVLTNSEAGPALIGLIKRKYMELLFDAEPQAAENLAATVKSDDLAFAKFVADLERTVPADVAKALTGTYGNADLGPLTITAEGDTLTMRTTSLKAGLMTRKNSDGTRSIVTVWPGFMGFPALIGTRDGKTALIVNDGQHEYVWLKN